MGAIRVLLVVKETRGREIGSPELRVAATPDTVRELAWKGYEIRIEAGAGEGAGFRDHEYAAAGGRITPIPDDLDSEGLRSIIAGTDVILRVKRAERRRERAETEASHEGLIMVGFLDPLDATTPHLAEWTRAGVVAFTMDQLGLSPEDPMNVLTAMSRIAGRQAVLHALRELETGVLGKAVVLGPGAAGLESISEAKSGGFDVVLAVGTSSREEQAARQRGADQFLILRHDASWDAMASAVRGVLMDADVVVAAARRAGEPAPTLIDQATLEVMKPGSVVIDLARTEGGNVEGSRNDDLVVTGSGVKVANRTGYPTEVPDLASRAYARGLCRFVEHLGERGLDLDDPVIRRSLITPIPRSLRGSADPG